MIHEFFDGKYKDNLKHDTDTYDKVKLSGIQIISKKKIPENDGLNNKI